MYQELMREVYLQWLQEFDHEAAYRRNLPQKQHSFRLRGVAGRAKQRVQRRRTRAALTPPLAQQCN